MDDKKRLEELADRSYSKAQYTFTDFLSLAEQAVYFECERELSYAHPVLYGGCDIAERKMIRFGNEDELGYVQDFPISAIRIRPSVSKFSDDLNHRDFLGALMNLGIKRETLGDILIRNNEACVFCKDSIADFIIKNLTRIKHTTVEAFATDDVGDLTKPKLEERVIQVQSVRADAVVARAFNMSRQDAQDMFPNGLVFINGRECTDSSRALREEDIVSVRGKGKFQYAQETGMSKKGKTNCRILIYK